MFPPKQPCHQSRIVEIVVIFDPRDSGGVRSLYRQQEAFKEEAAPEFLDEDYAVLIARPGSPGSSAD